MSVPNDSGVSVPNDSRVSDWNFGDVWELVADRLPDARALVHGGRERSWAEFDRRADGVARALLDAGVARQDKFAQYLYNGPEYLEAVYGAWKTGLVPVNTNYRYGPDELAYLWDNADAVAVVFHGSLAERAAEVRPRVPRVRLWLWVDDGTGECPDWAVPYEAVATASGPSRVRAPWGRSGDDLFLLYTGGTTGRPKGVMWRQDDLFVTLNRGAALRYPEDGGLDDVRSAIQRPGFSLLPACPLMHGTGVFTSLTSLSCGGSVVTLTSRHFDVEELLDTVERDRVTTLVIVGDAFAKPVLRSLDGAPGRWDLSSLKMIVSSGVMWSASTKQGLLRHLPRVYLVDTFASSEAINMGSSLSSAKETVSTASFSLSPDTRVVTDDDRWVEPGSPQQGMVAQRGRVPIGYYKDEEKSARTFRMIEGQRWSIPGDYATVEADGTIRLLGRGSQCINTGGEKVYPEEVEEVLKEHPSIRDAVAVGVPDERFGEAITAVVELTPGAQLDEPGVIAHVKSRLAPFKAPKQVVAVETIGRSASGKVDYRRIRDYAVTRVR